MKLLFEKPSFSKSLLAGFMVGLATSVVVLIFQEIYREQTAFTAGYFISPAYIFVFIPIISALTGCLYYICRNYLRRGTFWFILICAIAITAMVWATISGTEHNTGPFFSGFRGMYVGIESITLILAAIFIPYLVQHPKFWYEEYD